MADPPVRRALQSCPGSLYNERLSRARSSNIHKMPAVYSPAPRSAQKERPVAMRETLKREREEHDADAE